MNIDWMLAGQVVFSGLIVVFVALIALIFLIWVVGKVLSSVQRSDKPQTPVPPSQTAAQKTTAAVRPVSAAPVVEAGIEEETVAVLTAAALCAMEQAGVPAKNCVVKSVRRSRVTRPIWSFEGMQQNTRPF